MPHSIFACSVGFDYRNTRKCDDSTGEVHTVCHTVRTLRDVHPSAGTRRCAAAPEGSLMAARSIPVQRETLHTSERPNLKIIFAWSEITHDHHGVQPEVRGRPRQTVGVGGAQSVDESPYSLGCMVVADWLMVGGLNGNGVRVRGAVLGCAHRDAVNQGTVNQRCRRCCDSTCDSAGDSTARWTRSRCCCGCRSSSLRRWTSAARWSGCPATSGSRWWRGGGWRCRWLSARWSGRCDGLADRCPRSQGGSNAHMVIAGYACGRAGTTQG